eukprot:Amastigsp_a636_557.p2 type:complete len:107 gc:universal Amastigsp_a636_557:615-935(+)
MAVVSLCRPTTVEGQHNGGTIRKWEHRWLERNRIRRRKTGDRNLHKRLPAIRGDFEEQVRSRNGATCDTCDDTRASTPSPTSQRRAVVQKDSVLTIRGVRAQHSSA